MSRVDPNVPVEESVGGMAELIREGKTRYISLSECSAGSIRRGSAVHPLASLQMEYSLSSRDAEVQGQIDTCRDLKMAMMAYAVLGRGMLTRDVPKLDDMTDSDIRKGLPRFHPDNVEKNLELRAIASSAARSARLSRVARAAPGRRMGTLVVPIPGAKSRKHLNENVMAASGTFTATLDHYEDVPPHLAERIGAQEGTRGQRPLTRPHRVADRPTNRTCPRRRSVRGRGHAARTCTAGRSRPCPAGMSRSR
jgi:aryl-alcohol dehydrogenase-like predicted oxidoreductase